MNSESNDPNAIGPSEQVGRRTILAVGGLAAAGILSAGAWHSYRKQMLEEAERKKRAEIDPQQGAGSSPPTRVFIAKNQRYDADLARTVRDGFLAVGLQPAGLRGKRVLLKPNMVEPSRDAPHMTTHPAMIVAAVEVFREWGAEVIVGEGPGHIRDTESALVESGISSALKDTKTPFADLNYEETGFTKNLGGAAKDLKGFFFPNTVLGCDLIVSMPKMKTHHWMGVTASMKNMYGVIPGIRYGWPKNVLHFNGIPNTVFDINATLPRTIALIDAIDCMEGDGPIMGTPKHMGLVIVGIVPAAVDATVCRLMKVRPERIPYLHLAGGRLGPLSADEIEQAGEPWEPLAQPFEILDVEHLRGLRAEDGEKVS